MYLATRSIRSAGRSSGSVEITLPTQLQVLEGIECHLVVRDGTRPEIVLQPDVTATQTVFRSLWQKLALGLGEAGGLEANDVGEFSPADFALALFPPVHWQDHPPLAYADALMVRATPLSQSGEGAGVREGQYEALARLLTSLATVAGQRLGLSSAMSLAFGDAVAYVMTDVVAGVGTDFERGMAHRLFWEGRARQALGSPLAEQTWREARPAFRRIYEQFRTWQKGTATYATARTQWYRGLALEMDVPQLKY